MWRGMHFFKNSKYIADSSLTLGTINLTFFFFFFFGFFMLQLCFHENPPLVFMVTMTVLLLLMMIIIMVMKTWFILLPIYWRCLILLPGQPLSEEDIWPGPVQKVWQSLWPFYVVSHAEPGMFTGRVKGVWLHCALCITLWWAQQWMEAHWE